jgi:nickel transport protein
MKVAKRWLTAGALWVCLAGLPHGLQAQTPADESTQEVTTLLKEQNSKLSAELRRIQREIAALRADLDKPGLGDVFAGIGYIFGLFGVAAYVASRRKKE